ncbi:MAG: tRNA (adenosine(37)-N6)-dimethylallyltransferase MiaA [Alphaproteobacteria bacterium]
MPMLVIAGPTAGGKSALALAVAQAFDAVIINADSMQVYRDLRVLTARPDEAALALVPHRLYGVLDAAEIGSAAWWLEQARQAVAQTLAQGRLPLLVGGSGLYLRALLHGLAPVAEVPAPVRTAARAMMEELGPEAFHQRLAARDPEMAARLRPTDPQRLVRAWEVLEATGRSLAQWQRETPSGPAARVAEPSLVLLLMPPRSDLYAACDHRLSRMVEDGALEEVRRLMHRDLTPTLPILKSLAVPELARHLRGEITLEHAVTLAQASTRHYAKRQCTWFRHQLPSAVTFEAQYSEALLPEIFTVIRRSLLTGNS